MPSACTWSCSLKPKCCLTISASACAISMYVVSFLEAQALPHDFPLFVCHRYVRGLVPSSTSAASRFLPLRVPSGSTWSSSLEHNHYLTISASSCAISMYVVSFFQAQALPHDFRLFVCHQEVRVSFLEAQVPPHNFRLFMCHQGVRGLVL